jgi:hypothetical protein
MRLYSMGRHQKPYAKLEKSTPKIMYHVIPLIGTYTLIAQERERNRESLLKGYMVIDTE